MTLLIILFVLGLVLGSWLMVRPSKRARQIAVLREVALAQHFKVMLGTRVESIPKMQIGVPLDWDKYAFYYLQWDEGLVMEGESTIVLSHRFGQPPHANLLNADVQSKLETFLEKELVEIAAIIVDKSYMGFLWEESGNVNSLSVTLEIFSDLQKFIQQQLKKNL